jgi:beta-galactosidase/beta-glucuronidase
MASYPRPDWQRPNLTWQSLNGPWSFLFDDDDVGLTEGWAMETLPSEATTHKRRNIEVPYAWQCPASGIEDRGVHEVFWYERRVENIRTAEQKKIGDRVLLRFGAVDYEAKVWVNGNFVGGHRGGHVPFDIDVSDELLSEGKNTVVVRVYDSAYDLTQPRGKQYWKAEPENIWYTPSGGIWQNVWMEVVPGVRIGDSSSGTVLRSNDIESGKLKAGIRVLGRRAGQKYSVVLEVGLAGEMVSRTDKIDLPKETELISLEANMRITDEQKMGLTGVHDQWLNNVALWTPEHPNLYDVTIRLFDSTGTQIDEILTTTGMRSLSWDNSQFRLNDAPYFQALFLDQGYWPDTFMTPPSPEALKTDIELSKKMGFNGCRKHQKVEDPVFLYYADRLGFLVWGEMANAYEYSSQYVERFDAEWKEAVLRDINHPSIVAWTPINESWGYTDLPGNVEHRNHIKSLYYQTKTLDPTRPINDNCGWEHVLTDLSTFHDYTDGNELTETCKTIEGIVAEKGKHDIFLPAIPSDAGSSHQPSAPILCTEFGGVNIARSASSGEKDWGYTTASDPKDLLKRIEKMMTGIVEGGLICGFVYTQLTDIEQEVNGLYTPDRKEKLDAGEVRKIVEGVRKRYLELLK